MTSMRKRKVLLAAPTFVEAPKYEDVKRAAIEILAGLSTDIDLAERYGKPKADPVYSAETELDSIGVNADVRRLRTKLISSEMNGRFDGAWLSVAASTVKDQETIGAFIVLMCSRTRGVTVPFGEPT